MEKTLNAIFFELMQIVAAIQIYAVSYAINRLICQSMSNFLENMW